MHFIRLIRPINLAIIALTMYGVWFYAQSFSKELIFHQLDFALLVLSTMIIAAGGNIINDYFDVRADRINKPDRLIISKHIKRRWAIVLHWICNLSAFTIAGYLSIKYHTIWFVVIHVTSITFLWWYSVKLKKIPLIGNLVVSLLSVLVIYLTILFIDTVNYTNEFQVLLDNSYDPLFHIRIKWIIFIFMGMAFVQNLAREIVKDIEDVEGDKVIGARTIPMILGNRKTLILIGVFLSLFPLGFFIGINMYYPSFDWKLSAVISVAAIINGINFLLCLLNTSFSVKAVKTLLKVSMLVGLIYLYQYS